MTKKGVLIVNWEYDYPIIRKAKFIKEDSGDKNDICYFEFNNDVLAVGDKDVKKILNGINGNFIEKEEHFFYIINVKIKGLDTFFSASLKEKICFVDLLGYGTGNKFETKDIYSKFIKSCKLFVLDKLQNCQKIFCQKKNMLKMGSFWQFLAEKVASLAISGRNGIHLFLPFLLPEKILMPEKFYCQKNFISRKN